MEYLKCSKKGATVTVFAPYDCNNMCPFCINKKDYFTMKYNIEKTKQSIVEMSKITPNCDFVITGGEPLANIPLFLELVSLIKKNGNHKLYVNTTLPIQHKDIQTLNSYKNKIDGLNISRHLKKYVKECPDEWLEEIEIPIRINCVIFNEEEVALVPSFVKRFNEFNIQFRDNYINVNHRNLLDFNISNMLISILGVTPISFNNDFFRWNIQLTKNISFHRTQCYSKIRIGNKFYIGDIIINIEGQIMDDWNEHGQKLNLKKYEKAKVKEFLFNE